MGSNSTPLRHGVAAEYQNLTLWKHPSRAEGSNSTSLRTGAAASDFTDNEVTRAKFKDTSETIYAHGSTGGVITLSHENGHYQTITTTTAISLTFTNWPATATLGRIILDITFASTTHTITIPSSVLVASNVSGGDGSSDTITVPTSGRYLYEFMTPDAGTTILMHQIGNNYI